MIKKNSWVQISKEILQPHERAENLPEPTKKVPLKMWVKGHLLEDAEIGDEVKIMTITGRMETGVLLEENPTYMHNYGKFIPEILEIDRIVKSTLRGGDSDE